MPQFDQSSYLSQITFVLFFGFLFYILITYYLIPEICTVKKFRTKKNHLLQDFLRHIDSETLQQQNSITLTLDMLFLKFDNDLQQKNNVLITELTLPRQESLIQQFPKNLVTKQQSSFYPTYFTK